MAFPSADFSLPFGIAKDVNMNGNECWRKIIRIALKCYEYPIHFAGMYKSLPFD